MLITEEYRDLNAQLHANRQDYGKRGSRWAEMVMGMCMGLRTTEVLDYGCGKGDLNLHLPFSVQLYDPALPKYSGRPVPSDIVVCADVLEHVEPDCLDEVLDDLKRVTKRILLLNVATRPAVKTLADGRNAHLIVEEFEWWEPHIAARFVEIERQVQPGHEFTMTLEPKPDHPLKGAQ